MTYKNRKEQRNVCETMSSVLLPIKNYCNENVSDCIDITLKILSETPVESEEIMTIEEVIKRCEEVAEVQEEAAKEWHENQVRKCKLFPFAEMDYTHENECKKCADEHRQLAKWLEQLQKIQEIIKCWENGTLKEKDSVYAFHKICEVMENGTNDKRRNKTKK